MKKRDASLRRAILSSPGLCDCEHEQIAGVPKTEGDGTAVEAAISFPMPEEEVIAPGMEFGYALSITVRQKGSYSSIKLLILSILL